MLRDSISPVNCGLCPCVCHVSAVPTASFEGLSYTYMYAVCEEKWESSSLRAGLPRPVHPRG